MISWLAVFLTSWLAGAPAAAGYSPQAAAPDAATRLEPLAWLVGGTWTTEEPDAVGGRQRVFVRGRWAPTRSAILFDVSYESAGRTVAQYDGMYLWHPGRRALVLWQVNRKGEVNEGTLSVTPAGDLEQVSRTDHPDGSVHFTKVTYHRIGPDDFRFVALFRASEAQPWQPALDLLYHRGQ